MVKRLRASAQDFLENAKQFLTYRDDILRAERPRDEYKKKLKTFIDANGVEDADGNRIVEFDKPVVIEGTRYTGLMQEKRGSPVVVEEKALRLVRRKRLLSKIPAEQVTVYDWEALYRLNAQGKITDDELDEVMEENVTWALKVVK